MRPILFSIAGRPVYAYGLSLTLAFLLGAWIGARRARAAGVPSRHVFLTAAWAFLAAIAGSRLLYLLVEHPELLARPSQWAHVWEGGLVFYGGFAAALASSALYARIAGISFWRLADILAPAIAIGHAVVRVGCFLNGCCYGKPASWGVVFPSLGDQTPRQPTQLYEAVAGIGLYLLLIWWERRAPRAEGELLLLYIAAYGAARFLIELVRDDDRGTRFLGLTISQLLGLAACAVGSVLLWLGRNRDTPGSTRLRRSAGRSSVDRVSGRR